MKVTVEKASPSRRVLTIALPAERVEDAYKRAFDERRKSLKLKGFRKGNVPVKIAKKHITDAHLVRQVVNLLVPPAYKEALAEKKLQPLGKPDWTLKQSDRGGELVFEAVVHVMPILKIKGYKGRKVRRPAIRVAEKQIEQILDRRRQGVARYVDRPTDHRALMGDFCFIDYSASHKNKPLPDAEVSNFLLELKEDRFLPGFVNKLVGATSGQELEFKLRLPENYAHQQLAGEEVLFSVKIHQIKERQVPNLDDEFARQHCNAESLEKLKERVVRNLESQQKKQVEEEIVNEIVSSLVSEIDLDIVPTQLRDGHARLSLRTQTQTLERQGLSLEKWLASRSITMEHFSEELNLTGLVEARLEILYRSLASQLEIAVTNKEVDQVIINQAKSNRTSPKDLKRKMIQEDTYKLLAYRLLIGKIRKRLLELSDITYESDTESKPEPEKVAGKKSGKKASKKKTAAKKKTTAKKKSASKKKTAKKKSTSKKKTTAKKKSTSKKKTAAKKKSASKKKSSAKKKTAKSKPKSKSKSKKTSRKKDNSAAKKKKSSGKKKSK